MKNIVYAIVFVLFISVGMSVTPRTMGYSARLTNADGMALDDPDMLISFRIYDSAYDGTLLWGETLSVEITDGFLDIDLGIVRPIALKFDGQYWLELQLDSNDDGAITLADEILAPREKFMPVSYSQRATYADTADYYDEAQSLADVLSEGNDAEGIIITGLPAPTSSDDAANKAYVDASDGGVATTYCVYVDYPHSCPAGWTEIGSNSGPLYGGSRTTKICCQSEGSALNGYLVLSYSTHNGSFAGYSGASTGLEGANLWCLDQVRNHNWKGKGDTDSLTASNVKAFLCDSDSCNNLEPNTSYKFASCYSTSDGGATFNTDGYGRGPRNGDYWHGDSYFDETRSYWMNRGNTISYPTSRWGNEPYSASTSCSDWTSTSSNGRYGYSQSNTSSRWSYSTAGCSNSYYLICIVNM